MLMKKTNLPLGIQLWGPKNSEIELLKVAKEFEEAGSIYFTQSLSMSFDDILLTEIFKSNLSVNLKEKPP